MLMPAVVFLPDVCFPESCHTGRCVYDGGRLLNQRMRGAVTALMVFTHVYSVYTLPNTCRPTRAPLVKVRWWLSRLVHVINIRHRELSSVYYIGLPMCQTPLTAIDARWRQAAYAQSCCIQRVTLCLTTVHAGTTKRIRIQIRILQSSNFRKKKQI